MLRSFASILSHRHASALALRRSGYRTARQVAADALRTGAATAEELTEALDHRIDLDVLLAMAEK